MGNLFLHSVFSKRPITITIACLFLSTAMMIGPIWKEYHSFSTTQQLSLFGGWLLLCFYSVAFTKFRTAKEIHPLIQTHTKHVIDIGNLEEIATAKQYAYENHLATDDDIKRIFRVIEYLTLHKQTKGFKASKVFWGNAEQQFFLYDRDPINIPVDERKYTMKKGTAEKILKGDHAAANKLISRLPPELLTSLIQEKK